MSVYRIPLFLGALAVVALGVPCQEHAADGDTCGTDIQVDSTDSSVELNLLQTNMKIAETSLHTSGTNGKAKPEAKAKGEGKGEAKNEAKDKAKAKAKTQAQAQPKAKAKAKAKMVAQAQPKAENKAKTSAKAKATAGDATHSADSAQGGDAANAQASLQVTVGLGWIICALVIATFLLAALIVILVMVYQQNKRQQPGSNLHYSRSSPAVCTARVS